MKYIQKYYFLLTGLIAFIFFLTTIAPSVIQIDTGELAAVQVTLGIAHPTGYPLFTILGYIFSYQFWFILLIKWDITLSISLPLEMAF